MMITQLTQGKKIMRISQMLFVTLREEPADAEIPSHKLLLRAGYIRRVGSGIYAYLPLMWRVLNKVRQIVKEEMDKTGALECLLPQLQPSELWKESGRWDTYTQSEGIMFALKDRQERELGLGPTHEEVITTIAKEMIKSYRQLPVHLYQIQSKFRDEIRPRFGLMRGREFIMKDGYSFHVDQNSLDQTYQAMYQAYSNMFTRCGLKFRAVDADSGAIGGSGSQEFMILAEAGEDEVLYTEDNKYAANVEKAISLPSDVEISPFESYEKRETPGTDTIAKLSDFLKCSPTIIVKNVLYHAIYDNGKTALVLISIRGDQEINEVKLQNELTKLAGDFKAKAIISLQVADSKNQKELGAKSLPFGYIAPNLGDEYIKSNDKFTRHDLKKMGFSDRLVGELVRGLESSPGKGVIKLYSAANIRKAIEARLTKAGIVPRSKSILKKVYDLLNSKGGSSKFIRIVDETAVNLQNFVTGANEIGYHWVGCNWNEQFKLPEKIADLRKAKAGDRAVHNPNQILQTARGIEVGHIFKLGTKYSQAMGANYTDENGKEKPFVMGCYGVGVSRLAQSAVEQSYDKDGIIWPVAIAPYHVIITIPNINDQEQVKIAEKLYNELNQSGVETLLDDRDERAGVKFKDADLIGIPYRIVTGKSIKNGKIELVERSTKQTQEIEINQVVSLMKKNVFG